MFVTVLINDKHVSCRKCKTRLFMFQEECLLRSVCMIACWCGRTVSDVVTNFCHSYGRMHLKRIASVWHSFKGSTGVKKQPGFLIRVHNEMLRGAGVAGVAPSSRSARRKVAVPLFLGQSLRLFWICLDGKVLWIWTAQKSGVRIATDWTIANWFSDGLLWTQH